MLEFMFLLGKRVRIFYSKGVADIKVYLIYLSLIFIYIEKILINIYDNYAIIYVPII